MFDILRSVLNTLAVGFDLPILDWIAANLRCTLLDTLMPLLTRLGDGGMIWILIAAVLLCSKKYRRTGLAMGFALLMGLMVCNLILKPAVARMRPFDFRQEYFGVTIQLLIAPPQDFSFPSGHTIASFEGATVLMLRSKKYGIPALLLACIIAFSRLYLYVHYPSDVITSLVLGILFGIVGYHLAQKVPSTGSLLAE